MDLALPDNMDPFTRGETRTPAFLELDSCFPVDRRAPGFILPLSKVEKTEDMVRPTAEIQMSSRRTVACSTSSKTERASCCSRGTISSTGQGNGTETGTDLDVSVG